MKTNHKILYHCGDNSSHRLLLVRRSRASDSWLSYVYNDTTGQTVYAAKSERGIDQALRAAQLAALYAGVSPCYHSEQQFAA